jgi:hypothetical protein
MFVGDQSFYEEYSLGDFRFICKLGLLENYLITVLM